MLRHVLLHGGVLLSLLRAHHVRRAVAGLRDHRTHDGRSVRAGILRPQRRMLIIIVRRVRLCRTLRRLRRRRGRTRRRMLLGVVDVSRMLRHRHSRAAARVHVHGRVRARLVIADRVRNYRHHAARIMDHTDHL